MEKVHKTVPKGIVGGFELLFFKEIGKNGTRDHGHDHDHDHVYSCIN